MTVHGHVFNAERFFYPPLMCFFGDAFKTFVKRGQLVGADEEVLHSFWPMSARQQVGCSLVVCPMLESCSLLCMFL